MYVADVVLYCELMIPASDRDNAMYHSHLQRGLPARHHGSLLTHAAWTLHAHAITDKGKKNDWNWMN